MVTAHIFAAIPREVVSRPDAEVARRVHTRCLGRYQAIGLLLSFDQSDDGYTLVRGLMADSQRLQVMARRSEDRLALALHWMKRAVKDLDDRADAAERLGYAAFAAGIRSVTTQQGPAIERVRRELGVGTLLPLPSGRMLGPSQPDLAVNWPSYHLATWRGHKAPILL